MIPVLILLSLLLIALYCFLIRRWSKAWNSIKECNSVNPAISTKLSVIIPVRNEEANLYAVLNSLSRQKYPSQLFEIIVSDDQSNDHTLAIARKFFKEHQNLKGIIIESKPNDPPGKKEALKRAINIAAGALIITTDADCTHNNEWLHAIASNFELYKPVMLCGPVLLKGDQSLFSQFQVTDYMSLQVTGAASIALNNPLLCSGANLAFSKNAFNEVNGYDDNYHIASGDDTFLMLKMHKRFPGQIHFLKSAQAIVTTNALPGVTDFLQQRLRWISKTKHYSQSAINLLGCFIFLINLFLLVLFFLSFLNLPFFYMAICLVSVKTIADYVLLSRASSFFNIRINKFYFILMEFIYPIYLLSLFKGMMKGSYTWKNRKHLS